MKRKFCGKNLSRVGDDENQVWCMIGDFNAVRNPNERKGISQVGTSRKEIKEFNNFI